MCYFPCHFTFLVTKMSNEEGANSELPIPPAPELDFYLFPEDVGRDDRVLKANFAFQQNGILTFGIDSRLLEANQNVIRQSIEEFANANRALLNQWRYSRRLEQWTKNGCILEEKSSISARNVKQFDKQVRLYMSGKCLLTHSNAERITLLYINIQSDLTVYPYGDENFKIETTTDTNINFDCMPDDPNSIVNFMRNVIKQNQESKPKIFAISLEFQRWLEDKKKEKIIYRNQTNVTRYDLDNLRRYITSWNQELLFQIGDLSILNELVFKDCFFSKTGNITKFYIAYSKQKYFRNRIHDIAIQKLEYNGTKDQKSSEGESSQIAKILSWISENLKEDKKRIIQYFFANFKNTYTFNFQYTPKQFLSLSNGYKDINSLDEFETFYDNSIDTIIEILEREKKDVRAFSNANTEEFRRRRATLARHQNAGQLYANVYQKMNHQFIPQKRFAFIEFRIHQETKGITYDYSIKPDDKDVIAT